MNVLVLSSHGFTLSSSELDLTGGGWPPRECFHRALIVDLRPLGQQGEWQAAIQLPLADPQLPKGFARSPWRGTYRWDPGEQCPLGAVAPDVFATLARSMGARVLYAVKRICHALASSTRTRELEEQALRQPSSGVAGGAARSTRRADGARRQ